MTFPNPSYRIYLFIYIFLNRLLARSRDCGHLVYCVYASLPVLFKSTLFSRAAIKTKLNCFNVVMSLVFLPLECLGVVFDPVIHSDDNLGDKGVVIYCDAVARDKMEFFVSL